MKQELIALDFESVLVPEAWQIIAEAVGEPDIGRTTRDEPDFGRLMDDRIRLLRQNGVRLTDAEEALSRELPLPGAGEFLIKIRESRQVVIISDTFIEFARPLLPKMEYPTIFCHALETDDDGFIIGYTLRENGHKRAVVAALQHIGFTVTAMGDSFNDIPMLKQAERGALLFTSDTVKDAHPDLPVLSSYQDALAFATRN